MCQSTEKRTLLVMLPAEEPMNHPFLDVVSLGPTMKSPHTTTERALIATVEPFWQLLTKTLADIPVK